MKTQELVNKLLIWSLLLIIIAAMIWGMYSCTKYEMNSPYVTGITVYEQREHSILTSDHQDVANIKVNSDYSFVDYTIDYENEKVIINLQKRNKGGDK